MPSLTINTNIDLGDADTKKSLMIKLTQVLQTLSACLLCFRKAPCIPHTLTCGEPRQFLNCGRSWRRVSGSPIRMSPSSSMTSRCQSNVQCARMMTQPSTQHRYGVCKMFDSPDPTNIFRAKGHDVGRIGRGLRALPVRVVGRYQPEK